MKRILIVIPAYNEEKIIAQNLERLADFCSKNLIGDEFKIILADNNSIDKTSEIVKNLAEKDNMIIYRYYDKKGKGLAVLNTWRNEANNFDIFVFMDADLSTDLSALTPLLLAIVQGSDIAVGSRYLKDSVVRRQFSRRFFSRGYNTFFRFLLGAKISDYACGFKAVSKKVVAELVPKIKNDQFFFDSELLFRAEKAQSKIKEIPVKWAEPRQSNESKVSVLKVAWRYFREILRLKRESNPNKLSRNEIKFIWLVGLILIAVTALPYLYGYLSRGDLYYTGAHIFSPVDTPVYYSYIEQAKDGHFLFGDLFSNELNEPRLFNPFWLLVGFVAKIFNLSAPIAVQVFRIILIPIFLFVLYKFISFFIGEKYTVTRKKMCFLYSIFATGLGGFFYYWLHADMNNGNSFNLAMDMWVPEASNFLIIFTSPHFIASITLIISIFYLFWLSLDTLKFRYSIAAGLAALFLFGFHPFFIPTIYFISFVYLIFLFLKNKKIDLKPILNYFLLVIISLPSALYYLYLLLTDSSLGVKAAQNICLTPGGINFFISYGLGLFFAIFAVVYLVESKRANNKLFFLIIWFWSSILLIYGPFNFQRRLTEGFQVPLTILAFIGFVIIWDLLKTKWKIFREAKLWQILPFFIFFFCFTNILVYYGDFRFLASKPEIVYIEKGTKTAMDWYRVNSGYEDTILASRIDGNLIPGVIGRRVFLGHDVETINYKQKLAEIMNFFGGNNDDQKKINFLKENRIDYLFYSVSEKRLGNFNPSVKNYLAKIYEKNGVEIFKVIGD
ncbi:MAG: glycosyltransferase [Patescibacteria group bacterium]|nr:glycosyltransferase [Patescibacteria group bacterium]